MSAARVPPPPTSLLGQREGRARQGRLRMAPPSGLRERIVASFLLGCLLFFPPLLVVFNAPVLVLGIPLLYLYLFAAWLTLIAVLAVIVERSPDEEAPPPLPAPPDPED